jgi:thiamine biosynthesis protein ThiS
MKILLNYREEELNGDRVTVRQMLEMKKFTFRMRIIKINGVLIPKEMYDSALIHEGDDVQMLYLMSGG